MALQRAIRLGPRDRNLGFWYMQIGRNDLLQSRIDEAILWLERARSASPAHPQIRVTLAAAYGLKGETDRAAAELAEARRLYGERWLPSIARKRVAIAEITKSPAIRALYETTYLAGLHKAGMPEE